MTTQMKRPDHRYKSEAECDAAEQAMIAAYFADSHPTNLPKDRAAAWWRFDPKYGAVLSAVTVGEG